MQRRDFVKAGLAAGAMGPAATAAQVTRAARADDDRHYYELRVYETRSDLDPGRLRTFVKDHMLAALRRAGAATAGVFSSNIGMLGQSLVLLVDWSTAADAVGSAQRLAGDAAYAPALAAFESDVLPPYVRYDAQLMRAFAGHRSVESPPNEPPVPSRVFEMRTYESRDAAALAKKIAMFNDAEIALFRSIGMAPVFFGENLYATRLPSLTYMLVFDDMAAREKAWRAFGSHPEWKRISTDPKYATPGITTVTSAVFLSALSFSPVR